MLCVWNLLPDSALASLYPSEFPAGVMSHCGLGKSYRAGLPAPQPTDCTGSPGWAPAGAGPASCSNSQGEDTPQGGKPHGEFHFPAGGTREFSCTLLLPVVSSVKLGLSWQLPQGCWEGFQKRAEPARPLCLQHRAVRSRRCARPNPAARGRSAAPGRDPSVAVLVLLPPFQKERSSASSSNGPDNQSFGSAPWTFGWAATSPQRQPPPSLWGPNRPMGIAPMEHGPSRPRLPYPGIPRS